MSRHALHHPLRRPALMALLTCLALLIIGPAALQARAGAVDRDAAVARVTATEFDGSLEGLRLYVMPDPLPAGHTVSSWNRDVLDVDAPSWFIFVDLHPAANWEHACLYLTVDAATGETRRVASTVPPNRHTEMIEITNGRDNPPPGVSEASLARFSEVLKSRPKPRTARGQSWAFIISGGASSGSNHIRYWNDSAFIYRTLVEYYGYADDHIRVCISDGTNPAADRSDGTNSPPDLDGDGDDDIEYPATRQYIGQVFGELAADPAATDQLFLFTTDHGGQESGEDCYLNLWNNEVLRDDEMADYIDALPCQTIICTFEQCYSGGMVDDLEGDGRVIATAAHWSEVSWAMGPDYIYDTFVYHWTSAVAGQNPDGTPVDADTNGDSIVSMHEAFVYAEAHDNDDETPQYSSTPEALGDALNLYGNLEGVYLIPEQVMIDDDALGASQGDGDGVIEFGETIELTIALHNMGQENATDVTCGLVTTSPFVSIDAASAVFEEIPSETTATNTVPLVFTVDAAVPDGTPLELSLALSEEPLTIGLDLAAAAPLFVATVSEINDSEGDEDGLADPGEDVSLKLRVDNLGHADSPELSGVLQSNVLYFQTDGTPLNVAALQPGASADVAWFPVGIAPLCPEIYSGSLTLILSGDCAAEADLTLMVGPWYDTVESDLAWTLGLDDDTATSGVWERVDPIGTEYESQAVQPEDDHTEGSGSICFVTGNGTVGGSAGENDVDGGRTTLLSPVFNLDGATSAGITYWRWYTNDLGNNPGEDYWDVDVSADGVDWIHLEHTLDSDNTWTERAFDLEGIVPFTDDVRFRFVADDAGNGSLVEAAVDDIMVTILRAPLTAIDDPVAAPSRRLVLHNCVPNPMNPSTLISFDLPADGPVSLSIYDVNGRLVETLLNRVPLAAGPHAERWDGRDARGRDAASGVYFVRLHTPAEEITRSVVMVR